MLDDLKFPGNNSIGPEEIEAASRVLKSGILSNFYGSWGDNFRGGIEVQSFEEEWSEYFSVKHSITMNSATGGLIAAVGAIGINPGDEVIVSPYTMTASASCVLVYGATPVFADIEPQTFNLDASSIEANITPKTKAIIVVHLAGQPADMGAIMEIARRKKILVIEDAAQSPGALYGDKFSGTIGDIGVFSLNCHKTIQTGEGGVCCTNNDELADRLRLIRNHGEAVVEEMGTSEKYGDIIGFNFRMGEIEAAIGREQLKKLDKLNSGRQEIASQFNEWFKDLPGLTIPYVSPVSTHVYYTYMMKIDSSKSGFKRCHLIKNLGARKIDFFEGYVEPLYMQPLYQRGWHKKTGRHYGEGLCPVAEKMYSEEVFYHTYLHNSLKDKHLRFIKDNVHDVWDKLE